MNEPAKVILKNYGKIHLDPSWELFTSFPIRQRKPETWGVITLMGERWNLCKLVY